MNVWIISGSRNWHDKKLLAEVLEKHCPYAELLVQGGAKGVDLMAGAWAKARGIHTAQVDALWNRYQNSAGSLRNHVMCDAFPYATLLALPLPGSIGTWECVRYARNKNMKVIVEKTYE